MPRAGLGTEAVIARAAEMLDDPRVSSLSIAALAESFGVRAPSLYKHVRGLGDLERGVAVRAKGQLADELGRAAMGASRDDAVRALSRSYRRWALAHPGQYPLTTRAPEGGDEHDVAVSQRLTDVVYAVLSGYGLEGDDLIDATRFLRSTLHGFVALETGRAFELPVDVERSFTRAVDSVIRALTGWSRR